MYSGGQGSAPRAPGPPAPAAAAGHMTLQQVGCAMCASAPDTPTSPESRIACSISTTPRALGRRSGSFFQQASIAATSEVGSPGRMGGR